MFERKLFIWYPDQPDSMIAMTYVCITVMITNDKLIAILRGDES